MGNAYSIRLWYRIYSENWDFFLYFACWNKMETWNDLPCFIYSISLRWKSENVLKWPLQHLPGFPKRWQNKINVGVSLSASLHRSIIQNKAVHNLFQSPNTGLGEMFLQCKNHFQRAKLRLLHPAPLFKSTLWKVNVEVNNLWSSLMFWTGFEWECVGGLWGGRTGGLVSSPQGNFVDLDRFWWDKGQQTHQHFVSFEDTNSRTCSRRWTLYMSITVMVSVGNVILSFILTCRGVAQRQKHTLVLRCSVLRIIVPPQGAIKRTRVRQKSINHRLCPKTTLPSLFLHSLRNRHSILCSNVSSESIFPTLTYHHYLAS